MHFLAGDIRRDEALRQDGRRHAERLGDERMLRFLRSVVPEQQFYLGDWEVAASEADAFIAERDAGSSHYMESNVRWVRALMCLARGDVDGAAADAVRSEERARESNDPQLVLSALAVRLRVELERDDAEAAGRLVDELLALPPEHAARPASIELALAARRLGRESAVRDWVEGIRYRSLWTDAALALVDVEFARAADVFSEIGSLPDEAGARMRAAEQLGAQGRPAQAHEQLGRALAFWRSVGATRYIRESEALLGDPSEIPA
jgi:hypothetical protein